MGLVNLLSTESTDYRPDLPPQSLINPLAFEYLNEYKQFNHLEEMIETVEKPLLEREKANEQEILSKNKGLIIQTLHKNREALNQQEEKYKEHLKATLRSSIEEVDYETLVYILRFVNYTFSFVKSTFFEDLKVGNFFSKLNTDKDYRGCRDLAFTVSQDYWLIWYENSLLQKQVNTHLLNPKIMEIIDNQVKNSKGKYLEWSCRFDDLYTFNPQFFQLKEIAESYRELFKDISPSDSITFTLYSRLLKYESLLQEFEAALQYQEVKNKKRTIVEEWIVTLTTYCTDYLVKYDYLLKPRDLKIISAEVKKHISEDRRNPIIPQKNEKHEFNREIYVNYVRSDLLFKAKLLSLYLSEQDSSKIDGTSESIQLENYTRTLLYLFQTQDRLIRLRSFYKEFFDQHSNEINNFYNKIQKLDEAFQELSDFRKIMRKSFLKRKELSDSKDQLQTDTSLLDEIKDYTISTAKKVAINYVMEGNYLDKTPDFGNFRLQVVCKINKLNNDLYDSYLYLADCLGLSSNTKQQFSNTSEKPIHFEVKDFLKKNSKDYVDNYLDFAELIPTLEAYIDLFSKSDLGKKEHFNILHRAIEENIERKSKTHNWKSELDDLQMLYVCFQKTKNHKALIQNILSHPDSTENQNSTTNRLDEMSETLVKAYLKKLVTTKNIQNGIEVTRYALSLLNKSQRIFTEGKIFDDTPKFHDYIIDIVNIELEKFESSLEKNPIVFSEVFDFRTITIEDDFLHIEPSQDQ